MPPRWILFKVVCILQMLLSSVLMIMACIHLFESVGFFSFIRVLLFLLAWLQAIFATNLLNNNYPNIPVAGKQKKQFNRLFLVNFLFLVFVFGIIFAEYRDLLNIARLAARPLFALPFGFFFYLLANIILLIFQFIIMYGLYLLRLELYINFMKKEFDFEKDQAL